jgi:hypothetical protein
MGSFHQGGTFLSIELVHPPPVFRIIYFIANLNNQRQAKNIDWQDRRGKRSRQE